jgi:hypothetical protein
VDGWWSAAVDRLAARQASRAMGRCAAPTCSARPALAPPPPAHRGRGEEEAGEGRAAGIRRCTDLLGNPVELGERGQIEAQIVGEAHDLLVDLGVLGVLLGQQRVHRAPAPPPRPAPDRHTSAPSSRRPSRGRARERGHFPGQCCFAGAQAAAVRHRSSDPAIDLQPKLRMCVIGFINTIDSQS